MIVKEIFGKRTNLEQFTLYLIFVVRLLEMALSLNGKRFFREFSQRNRRDDEGKKGIHLSDDKSTHAAWAHRLLLKNDRAY